MGAADGDRLAEAAERGDEREVRRLLESGADAKVRDGTGRTALMRAAEHGNARCVEVLLPESDARAKDKAGRTALMDAAGRGHADCVGLLLPASNAAARDRFGSTALMWAAVGGRAQCVERLLPVSDVGRRSRTGWTAAELAKARGHGNVWALIEGYVRSVAERDRMEALPKGASGPKAARRGI